MPGTQPYPPVKNTSQMSDKPYTVKEEQHENKTIFRVEGPGVFQSGFWSRLAVEQEAERMNAAYSAGQASPSTCQLSKDYDKLYEHLKGGGEAMAKYPDANYDFDRAILLKMDGRGSIHVADRVIHESHGMPQAFIACVSSLSLEWIAPLPSTPTS